MNKNAVIALFGGLLAFIVIFLIISSVNQNKTSEDNQSSITKDIIVGPVQVLCEGVTLQRCYQIKETPEDNWQLFYFDIEGFDYEAGYEYYLTITQTVVENSPADSSSIKSSLVSVNDKKAVPYIYIETPKDLENINANESIKVKGEGLGLFENNVVVTIQTDIEVLAQDFTTMATEEIGGEGVWEIDLALDLLQDTNAFIIANSPSPKEGEMGPEYAVPVMLSVTGGEEVPLEGTNWISNKYVQGDTGYTEGVEVTALFDNGTLSGNSGCNSYHTTYEINDNEMIISDKIAQTKMACIDNNIMMQEQEYLNDLIQVRKFYINGNSLTLHNELGETLVSYSKEIE